MVLKIHPDLERRGSLRGWGGAVCPACGCSPAAGGARAALCRACLRCAPPPPASPELRRLLALDRELRRLERTARMLGLSGWYRRQLDWQGARALLRDAAPGAFLVRDSGDERFIFSLSVQTRLGPTSIRLHYEGGSFRLDCQRPLARLMPTFECVVELVQHYVREGDAGSVWVDSRGCAHSPVELVAGLRAQPPSLAHAARLAVHRALAADRTTPRLACAPRYTRLPLPRTLLDYLAEYPYAC